MNNTNNINTNQDQLSDIHFKQTTTEILINISDQLSTLNENIEKLIDVNSKVETTVVNNLTDTNKISGDMVEKLNNSIKQSMATQI